MIKQLSEYKEGSIVNVRDMDCGIGLKKRLFCLGIFKGCVIKVIRNDLRGPVIVDIMNSRVAIGRGQAMKILVEG